MLASHTTYDGHWDKSAHILSLNRAGDWTHLRTAFNLLPSWNLLYFALWVLDNRKRWLCTNWITRCFSWPTTFSDLSLIKRINYWSWNDWTLELEQGRHHTFWKIPSGPFLWGFIPRTLGGIPRYNKYVPTIAWNIFIPGNYFVAYLNSN